MSLSLNPLANPKGVKLLCEVCRKSAFSQCTHCKVTFYCGRDHQAEDWDSIHSKVCSLLAVLRSPKPFLNSDEQRRQHADQRAEKQKRLVVLTSTEARRLLFDGQHRRAIPAAQLSLRSSVEVYGNGSLDTIPAMVVLGETCIGANMLNQAEQFLSQAKWCISQAGSSAPPYMVSQINRNLGRLYVVKGDRKRAMAYLAEDVYHSSLQYGTEHFKTSGGYFNMARAALLENDIDVAQPLYTQVLSSWYTFLADEAAACRSQPLVKDTRAGAPSSSKEARNDLGSRYLTSLGEALDEAQQAEALFMLQEINSAFAAGSILPCTSTELCQSHQTLAIILSVMSQKERANPHCQASSALCQAEERSEATEQLTQLQDLIQQFIH